VNSSRNTPRLSKINFFQPDIWQNGELEKAIDRNLSVPDDLYASGKWKPAYGPQIVEKYKDTLGGKAIESFDPNGFLAELGLPESLTAGRSNIELLRAFRLVDDYTPDSRYFPLPKVLASLVQNTLLLINLFCPRLVNFIDFLVTRLVVEKIEGSNMADAQDPDRYGKMEEIVKGERYSVTKEARYFGILRNQVPQYAWGKGIHTGSIDPDRGGTENFGTYDIAHKLGFTSEQARKIAKECYEVDTNKTHYRDPYDRTKPRITGASFGPKIGDLHRHYNRSPENAEDTRIIAARIHLDRALKLTDEGYYDAAERELGIGLHSLQDIFSHVQITPMNHTLLGEFPDFVKYHPLAMYETAVATEGYLRKFIEQLQLKALDQATVLWPQFKLSNQLVIGNCTPEEKSIVAKKLAKFPGKLTTFLKENGIHIFVGAEGTKLTELGFGIDLDGDGKVAPGKWVDVNKDGERQWFEVEDQFDNGRKWNEQSAAYNHQNRMIFISTLVLKDPKLEEVLMHEIDHAIDLTYQDHPELKVKWRAYIKKLYDSARRKGKIAFDELDPHEYFAVMDAI